jgi:hypothetical protein
MAKTKAEEKPWKSAVESLPTIDTADEIGRETIGVYVSSRDVNGKDKKKKKVYTLHRITQDDGDKEFFGCGLINWFIKEKVTPGTEIKLIYKGLEFPEKTPGENNRHQYDMFSR